MPLPAIPESLNSVSKITVVCTGNICRSPMGDVMIADALAKSNESQLDSVTVNSCGLGAWHVGEGADPRAVSQMAEEGYDGSRHVAATFGPDHADADLFLAMDDSHVDGLKAKGINPDQIYLFRQFDPATRSNAQERPEVADPYYGNQADFATAARQIEAAVPGILEFVAAVNRGK